MDQPESVKRRTAEVIELRVGGDHAVFIFDSQPTHHVLAISSSYGGYAFAWGAPGSDFKRFVANAGPDYLLGKLVGRDEEFDTDATAEAMRALIAATYKRGDLSESQMESERLHVDEFEEQGGLMAFSDWFNATHLGEVADIDDLWMLQRSKPGQRSVDFTSLHTKFWPALKAAVEG